jgi:membrane protein DedA with SNARE-associated domain
MPVSQIVNHFPYLGLFMLLFLGLIGPFPEDTTLVLCGFLIAGKMVEPVPALLVVYAGVLGADYLLYFVGKKYGRSVVTHRRMKKFISPERIVLLEEKFKKRGLLVILVGRHLVGLRSQLFIVAGIMRMPTTEFLIADAFSSLFTIALMVGAGYLGGHSLQTVESDVKRIGQIMLLFTLAVLAIYLLFRYFRVRRK